MQEGKYQKLTIVCQHVDRSTKKLLVELFNIRANSGLIKKKISRFIQIGCKAYINLSKLEKNNINQYIYITIIANEHCHELNYQLIKYKNEIALTDEIIEDIKFLITQVQLTIT